MWPSGAVVPAGRYRVHARVSGFVYRGPHGNLLCRSSPARYHPGGVPDPSIARARILEAQVVLTGQQGLQNAEAPDPKRWKIISLSPASPDSSVYEGEIIVSLVEPYAVTFWRGSGIYEPLPCESAWTTDQTITITISPAPDTPPQQTTLNCSSGAGIGRVTRGDTLTCRVNKVNPAAGGSISVSSWSFDGVIRRDGDLLSPEWKGVMVKGGVVQVKARLGSAPEETLTATITVEDRDWSGKAPAINSVVVENGADPDPSLTLPARVKWVHHLGHVGFRPTAVPTSTPPDPTAEVRGGPNDGLYYYKDLSFFAYAAIVLNNQAMTRGSRFFEAQARETGNNSVPGFGGVNYCLASYVVTGLRQDVLRHEEKHVEVYQSARARELAPTIRSFEATTDSLGDAEMVDAYRAAWGRADSVGVAESRRVVDGKGSPFLLKPAYLGRLCQLKNEWGEDLRNEDDQ